MTLRYDTTNNRLEVITFVRPGVERTSLCHRCAQPLFYSPIAQQWWHPEHGSIHCAMKWDEHMGEPPPNTLFIERGRVFFAYWGEPIQQTETSHIASGIYWTEEQGDGEAIVHTPKVLDEDARGFVHPVVRRVGGGYVMEG